MKKDNKNKISIDILEELLNYKYLETSYKIFWMQALLEESKNGKTKIYFKELAIRMIVYAWDPIVNKGITFGRMDKLYRIIADIQKKWHIEASITPDDLKELLENIFDEALEVMIEELYQDTPYRLLEPLYEKQLKGKKDSAKNNIIDELSYQDISSLYRINSNERYIILNPVWVNYISKNRKVVEGWIHDKLAYFLERKAMTR